MRHSDWISVEDKLPKTGERVIVCRKIENEMFVDIATYIKRDIYSSTGAIFYFDDGFDSDSITHWQRIVLPKKIN